MRARAMTLTELAVVIFIIVLLIGGGMYLISGAIRTARTLSCLDNLKAQGISLFAATQASPITGIPGLKGYQLPKVEDSAGASWRESLMKLGGAGDAIFVCPEAPRHDRPSYGMNPLAGAVWSYTRGMFYGGFLLMPAETQPRNLEMIRTPGRTLIITDSAKITADSATRPAEFWEDADASWQSYIALPFSDPVGREGGSSFNYGYDWGNNAPGNCRGSMPWEPLRRPFPRHPARCGTLFLDGHAESLDMPKIVEPQWNSVACLFDNQ